MAKKNNKKSKRRNGMNLHPSVTGLAAGLGVASWLNSKSGYTYGKEGKNSVIGWLADGNIEKAAGRFIENGKTSFTQGRKTMISAIVLASAGAVARKHLPNTKIGGSKYYFRI